MSALTVTKAVTGAQAIEHYRAERAKRPVRETPDLNGAEQDYASWQESERKRCRGGRPASKRGNPDKGIVTRPRNVDLFPMGFSK